VGPHEIRRIGRLEDGAVVEWTDVTDGQHGALQPEWTDEDDLLYLDDATGRWNL
jgi:hypothetical protein